MMRVIFLIVFISAFGLLNAQNIEGPGVIKEKGFLKRKLKLSVMKIHRDTFVNLNKVAELDGIFMGMDYNNRLFQKDKVALYAYVSMNDRNVILPLAIETEDIESKVLVDKHFSNFYLPRSLVASIVSNTGPQEQYIYFIPVLYNDNSFIRYKIATDSQPAQIKSSPQKRMYREIGFLDPSPPAPPRLD